MRTASRRLSVPRALTSKSVLGSTSEVVTATCPARWRIASWSLTCSVSALAFLTSSFMNAVRFGYRVISHLRLRSVPGRLRLSSRVTNQPSLIMWIAALTPRKPAPPVIRIRRSGWAGSGGRDFVLVTRSEGSIAALTLAGGYTPQVGDAHDPRRAGEDQRFAPRAAALAIEIGAGQENNSEGPVDEVEKVRRPAAQQQAGQAEQTLQRGEAGHDQVGRPEAPADGLVAEVVVGAPEAEHHRVDDQDAGAVAVEESEGCDRGDALGAESGDLPAEVLDGESQSLLELDARLPAELLFRSRVVEGDPIHVAFARRPKPRLEPVLGQKSQLAKQVVHRDRDAGADVKCAVISLFESDDVRHCDIAHVEHV